MKEISILTWYKANNHGAILQAYASKKVLENLNMDVSFVNYNREIINTAKKTQILNKKLKKILNLSYLNKRTIAKFDAKKMSAIYSFINENLNIVPMYEKVHDTLMVGSDMVFSLGQGYNPYMFGINMNYNRIFSYAACAGGSTINLVRDYGDYDAIESALLDFSGIGCRDKETEFFVKMVSGRTDTVENIDPVLLYGYEDEKKQWDTGKWVKHNKYVLLYSYHENMNKKGECTQIKRFAKEKGYSIISVGYHHFWCDENINASPKEFLEIFNNAQYVFTDTFHGTVFSLITNTPFVSITRGNAYKIRDLLEKCGYDNRIANENDIYEKTKEEYSFEEYNKWIIVERENSLNYIKKQLGM